ncbi:hypothetical protein [Natronomonas sp. EA1]|uniref:DUF7856 family protein n=1 Tax=Natronomonas sp. EA1 TaxID=3421655 RepID=UPI003EBF3BA5
MRPRAVAELVREWYEPGACHERIGLVAARPLDRRVAIATVARARGHTSPHDDALRECREALATTEAAGTNLRAARRAVAEAGTDVARLRERAATLRGRVQARREAGLDADEPRTALREVARELSEAETDRTAAEQTLARERERARDGYDARARRLELEDRIGNLEREARASLEREFRPRVDAAVARAPGPAAADSLADATDATARLALARLAPLDAPVVLATDHFDSPTAARDWLGSPVILL